jgi:hypothetical protein
MAGVFLASQPSYLSRICFDLPHHMLGSWAQPRDMGFPPAVVIALYATKPVSSETSKAERGQVATIVLSGTRGPWLFLVIREGLGSNVRLRARGHTAPNKSAETRSRTKVSREPDGHRLKRFPEWCGSIQDTQAVCGFRCWASKHTPLFHTISTIVAIFLAKVSRAISGRMPLATRAA